MQQIQRVPPGPGQESVWDYPRPPALERSDHRIQVVLGEAVVAESDRALRVLETSHPPTYYVPPADVDRTLLRDANGGSVCEWKGIAIYWDVVVGGRVAPSAAWGYPSPTVEFAELRDHVAFYPSLVECWVDGELVEPQPGGFYGGWVTSHVVGPFKGAPGTMGW